MTTEFIQTSKKHFHTRTTTNIIQEGSTLEDRINKNNDAIEICENNNILTRLRRGKIIDKSSWNSDRMIEYSKGRKRLLIKLKKRQNEKK